MRVLVETLDFKSGALRSRVINFDEQGRSWLVRNIEWACNNGNGVQISNVKDEDIATASTAKHTT